MIGLAAAIWITGGVLLGVLFPSHPWLVGVVVAALGIGSVWAFQGLYAFFEGSLEGWLLPNRESLVGNWRQRFAMLTRFGADFTPPIIAGTVAGGAVLGGLMSMATHSPLWTSVLFGIAAALSFVMICKDVGGAALGARYGAMAGIVFGPFYSVILAGGIAMLLNSASHNVEAGNVVIGARLLGIVLGTFVSWPGCAVLGFFMGAVTGAVQNVLGGTQGAVVAALLAAGLALGLSADELYVAPMVAATLGAWLSTRPLRPQ